MPTFRIVPRVNPEPEVVNINGRLALVGLDNKDFEALASAIAGRILELSGMGCADTGDSRRLERMLLAVEPCAEAERL